MRLRHGRHRAPSLTKRIRVLTLGATVAMGAGLLVGQVGTADAQVVTATIPVSNKPYDVAVSPDGTRAYVANLVSANVSVINTATNTVITTVGVGGTADALRVTPDGTAVYVATTNGHVSVVNTASESVVATIPIGGYASGISITPDGRQVYVSNANANNVSVIDTSSNTVVTTVPAGFVPYDSAVTPDGSRVYVANQYSNNLTVIDTSTNTVAATVPAGNGPYSVAFTPDGSRAYVPDVGSNSVAVLDTASNTVITNIPAGTYPHNVAITPDGSQALVTNAGSGTTTVIDTATNTVTGTVGVGSGPFGVAITPNGAAAYVANRDTNTVSVISLAEPPAITSAASAGFVVGEPGSFTVTTSGRPAAKLSESGPLPTGVTFTDDGDGTATLAGTPAGGSVNSYPITISAANPAGTAQQSFTLTVSQASAAVSLAASTDTAVAGSPVEFTATVTTPDGETLTPTGDVSFYVNDASTPAAVVPLSGDTATWTTSNLAAGTDRVVADYRGDSNFTGAVSTAVTVTVTKAPTTLTATPALARLSGLKLYLFDLTATLTGPYGPISGAPITFTVGSRTVCTAVTDASGTAHCNAVVNALSVVLSFGYRAGFAGDEMYLPSTARAGLIS